MLALGGGLILSLPARHQTATINIRPSRMPGTTPAMNMRPTDTSVTAAYTTITIYGGIRIPSVPALQITPAPNSWL